MLFEQVFTPVPLTLPAHASLFTGRYPPANGVRDNGEALPSSVPTLAEHLRGHGFDTAAFVAAFVLDRRFGLARGFDEYWGEFPLYRFGGLDPGTIQFRGDRVEQAATQWIANHRLRPFFAFVHFYDYARVKDWDKARDRLEAAVSRDPRKPEAHIELARVFLEWGSATKALQQLREAARLSPDSAEVFGLMSRAYLKKGEKAKAEEAAQRAKNRKANY